MSGSRKRGKRSRERIADEIKAELRSILHHLCELLRPLGHFYTSPDRPIGIPQHFVCFDRSVHHEVTGLRSRAIRLTFPVESITDRVALTAAAVWHLKDRLNHYAKVTGSTADSTAWANRSRNTQICGDIGNHKKHGHSQNFSGLSPRLAEEVVFDMSQSGMSEFYYNGATKLGELLVTNPVPIPYRVDVLDSAGAFLGNAADIIREGFDHWLPLIDQLGVLDGTGKDDLALREILDFGKAHPC